MHAYACIPVYSRVLFACRLMGPELNVGYSFVTMVVSALCHVCVVCVCVCICVYVGVPYVMFVLCVCVCICVYVGV